MTHDGRHFQAAASKSSENPDSAQANTNRRDGCHVPRHTAASAWLSAVLSLAKVAAYLGDTKEVVLATYAHFMPDDDRAREIMTAFFAPTWEGADHAPCARWPP